MKHEQFLEYHKEVLEKLASIVKAKNHDYSGGLDDAFSNFKSVEQLDVCSAEQGFLTRMMDKYQRVNNFVKSGVTLVEDEKIEDTLLDLANYSILMAGYIKHKKSLEPLTAEQAAKNLQLLASGSCKKERCTCGKHTDISK